MRLSRFIISFLVFLLISCSSGTETTYRLTGDKEEIIDCGFSLRCRYYINKFTPDGEIEVTITIDTIGNVNCFQKLMPKLSTVKFPNSSDTFKLREVYKDKEYPLTSIYYFTSKDLGKKVQNNKTIEVKISFSDSEKEKLFVLQKHEERYRTKENEIFWLLIIVIGFNLGLWLLLSYILSRIFKQLSLKTCQKIAGGIASFLFFLFIWYFFYWLTNYGA